MYGSDDVRGWPLTFWGHSSDEDDDDEDEDDEDEEEEEKEEEAGQQLSCVAQPTFE